MIDMIFPTNSEFEMSFPYFLVGVGYRKKQEYMKRDENCPYIEWLQTRSGRGELFVDGVRKSVGKNQGMLLYLNVPHEYYAVERNWEADWIIIGGKSVDVLFKSVGIDKCEVFNVNNSGLLSSKMEVILDIACGQAPMKSLDCSSLIYDFMIDLVKCFLEDNDKNLTYKHSRLEPVFNFIDDNFHKVITLDKLSSIAGLTPEYFCTLFIKITGMKVSEYINNVRIIQSKKLLINNKYENISDIAHQCGYEDVGYFNYVFKKYEKITPREFRKRY